MTFNKNVKETSTPTLQWLESEEETNQANAGKKGGSPTQTSNLQWLESEAEQEAATTK